MCVTYSLQKTHTFFLILRGGGFAIVVLRFLREPGAVPGWVVWVLGRAWWC